MRMDIDLDGRAVAVTYAIVWHGPLRRTETAPAESAYAEVVIGAVRDEDGSMRYLSETERTQVESVILDREYEEAEARHRAENDVIRRKEADQYVE